MDIIDSDKLDIISFGDISISVLKDSQVLFEGIIASFDTTATTVKESQVETIETFEDDEYRYTLRILSSLSGIEYELLCDDVVDGIMVNISESVESIESPQTNMMQTYTPLVKYTNKTKDLLFSIITKANKNIMPLVDIRKEKHIPKYIKDNFHFPHILDICDLHIVTNTEHRESIKKERRANKTDAPEIPEEIEAKAPTQTIIDYYIELKKKNLFMPVCRIDTSNSPTLEFGRYADALLEHFDKIVLRVMRTENFEKNIEAYLMKFSKILKDSCIIIEFNGINERREKEIISYISNLETGIQIIYAKETTNYDAHTISLNHLNTFPNTSLSGYFDRLLDTDNTLWYADYCGYDRDTATEFVIGMKPNASLYLLANDDAMDILILKIKHPLERGTAKWSLSIQMLIDDYIRSGVISSRFLESSHCNACREIASATSLTLAQAKYLSMLHNATVLAVL